VGNRSRRPVEPSAQSTSEGQAAARVNHFEQQVLRSTLFVFEDYEQIAEKQKYGSGDKAAIF